MVIWKHLWSSTSACCYVSLSVICCSHQVIHAWMPIGMQIYWLKVNRFWMRVNVQTAPRFLMCLIRQVSIDINLDLTGSSQWTTRRWRLKAKAFLRWHRSASGSIYTLGNLFPEKPEKVKIIWFWFRSTLVYASGGSSSGSVWVMFCRPTVILTGRFIKETQLALIGQFSLLQLYSSQLDRLVF